MYPGTALKLFIPFAIHVRQSMAEAHGHEGPDAEAANRAVSDLQKLKGVRPAAFTAKQRETARMALLWGEQYLDGWLDAVKDSYKAEHDLARKQRHQIRAVRFKHFGMTRGEVETKDAVLVDIREVSKLLSKHFVVCSGCDAKTNSRAPEDPCSFCKSGVFHKLK